MPNEGDQTVWVALAAGSGLTLAKVLAALVTNSPALAAEALTDTANDLFFLVAQRRSGRHRDKDHPFGYGKEAYVWALIAALGAFIGGAAFSMRASINKLAHPTVTSSALRRPRCRHQDTAPNQTPSSCRPG
jgi:divalent metal cation (Fe/Co/Zn/Cd) transporter